jgi:hypothetical protein
MKRLGPDLKMPDLKTPDFLVDLFYDLRDRRLLAPIALVVVAIAAVPFLLSGGSDESTPTPAVGAATAPAEAGTAKAATLTVVEAQPGLRDYHKRLAARKPTDPFKQRYTAPNTAGAELNQTESSSSSSSSTTITTGGSSETTISSETTTSPPTSAPSGPPTSTPPSTPTPAGGAGKPHLTFYTWGIDVRISRSDGSDAAPGQSQEPSIKHEVLPQTALPGPKAPVVTYMGLSRKAAQKHAARALLLVSDKVTSVLSEAKCVSGGDGKSCQLIEVEPGVPVTFLYGANETHYTIKLLKIELVVTGHS